MTIEEIENEIALLEPAEVNSRNVQILASLYVIRDKFGTKAQAPCYSSNSKFGKIVQECSLDDILPIVDELVEATEIYNPSLYKCFLNKFS